MLWIGIVSSFSFAAALWLVLSETSYFNPLKNLIRKNIRVTEGLFKRLVAEYMPQDKYLKKTIKYFNAMLLRSGIRRIIPWFGLPHLIFALSLTFVGVTWFFRELGVASLAYGAIGVCCVFAILFFMAALNKQAIRKMYLHFLNVYMGAIVNTKVIHMTV